MNKGRLYRVGGLLIGLGLCVGSYRRGYSIGVRVTVMGSVINAMAKIQYSLAYREGFRRGSDVACGANKQYEGPDFDDLHPTPDVAN